MPIINTPIDESKIKELSDDNEDEFIVFKPDYDLQNIILSKENLDEIESFISFYENQELIFKVWNLEKVMKDKKSINLNLYGVSGTGKTITAMAIAKRLNKEILVVDYSQIESKYVGETSKNLVKIFDYACKKDVILFFDEADALLSKRVTSMNSSTDVSVNQTRNVLLKLLDNFDGITIFATNFISNFDNAFLRRISKHIEFKNPDKDMRKKLWEYYIVEELPVDNRVALIERISEKHKITGADISNIVLKVATKLARTGEKAAKAEDFEYYIDESVKIKEHLEDDKFTVEKKKVSKEYVDEKMKEGVVDGTV